MSGQVAPLQGVAEADARLGAPFPLPARRLPLTRWVEVRAVAEDGAEIEWNLDDTRPGSPGRLALCASRSAVGSQLPHDAEETLARNRMRVRRAPLTAAQPALRPVVEILWEWAGLHLRLTAQGPWPLAEVVALAESVGL